MNQELENKLAKDFPFMVAKNVWTGEICLDGGNTYGFPCECMDGWYQLIHDLCQELSDLYKHKDVNVMEIQPVQIKEKFGGLRFYTNSLIDGGHEIIDKYEELSFKACEVCGAIGQLRTNKSWWQTLCDEHNK